MRKSISYRFQRLLMTFLFVICLALYSQPANGVSIGGISLGSFTTRANYDTGKREWVQLISMGHILIGQPRHKDIILITIEAPGHKGGHLILRELLSPDNERILLLSAPPIMAEKIRHITLYVKHDTKNLTLLEYDNARWQRWKPRSRHMVEANSSSAIREDISVFSMTGLGLYWLLDGEASDASSTPITTQDASAFYLLGGSLSRGFLPWGVSVLLLIVGWAISRWAHQSQRHRGS